MSSTTLVPAGTGECPSALCFQGRRRFAVPPRPRPYRVLLVDLAEDLADAVMQPRTPNKRFVGLLHYESAKRVPFVARCGNVPIPGDAPGRGDRLRTGIAPQELRMFFHLATEHRVQCPALPCSLRQVTSSPCLT